MSSHNSKESINKKKDLSNGEVLDLQEKTGSSDKQEKDSDEEEDSDEEDNNEEDGDGDDGDGDDQSGASSHVAIDLSENDIYKGICTLFEDENGNNILEYISLLHSELIGHNKTMKSIKKDLSRIADCAEIMAKKMK